jgi:hypothetical protein
MSPIFQIVMPPPGGIALSGSSRALKSGAMKRDQSDPVSVAWAEDRKSRRGIAACSETSGVTAAILLEPVHRRLPFQS